MADTHSPLVAPSTNQKRQVNRAVAALAEALGTHAAAGASPILSTRVIAPPPQPITRFPTFDALLQSRLQKDPHVELRVELSNLQVPPAPRDESAMLADHLWMHIISYLGYLSRDFVRLTSTCRRLRDVGLIYYRPLDVNLAPDRLGLEQLSQPTAMASITNYFQSYTRGQHVRQLAYISSHVASVLPLTTTSPRCDVQLTFGLLAELPCLTTLDVRGVVWQTSPRPDAASSFLGDVHLVAPKLHTLKITMELLRSWSAGWWHRLPDLSTIVVGSRRDQLCSAAHPHTPVELHQDLYTMLGQEKRSWRLKLWCGLDAASMQKLVQPLTAYPGVVELALNLYDNTAICAQPEGGSHLLDGDGGKRNKAKRSGTAGQYEDGDAPQYPRLTALTVCNVEARSLAVAEVLGRFTIIAPKLQHFNLCNTVRVPPPEKPKGKRRMSLAATRTGLL